MGEKVAKFKADSHLGIVTLVQTFSKIAHRDATRRDETSLKLLGG